MLQRLEDALSKQGFCFFLPRNDYVTFLNPDKKMMTVQRNCDAYWLFLGDEPSPHQILWESDDLQDLLDYLLLL
jgi:hypothetical protein